MLLISILVISIIGTLSHFLYDMSKHNKFIGLFGAVNESTWEHIKIALTPTILWALVDGYMYRINPNYFLAKFVSLLTIIVIMPLMFYGYKHLLKKHILFVDIIIFYLVITCSQCLFFYVILLSPILYIFQYLACVGTFILFACYMVLTLMPIKNFLFKDPISNEYGFDGHTESGEHSHHSHTHHHKH